MVRTSLLVMCLIFAIPCSARTITVDDDGPADFSTIQAGIDDAGNGDVVLVKDGTYKGTGNKNLDFGGKAITVCSENGPEVTIIDCEHSGRGFYLHNREKSNSVVQGFTITNGYADQGGGMMLNMVGATIKECIFTNNTATSTGPHGGGGGMWINGTLKTCTIRNCIFVNNYAVECGGAICLLSNPLIVNCTIIKNRSGNAGGGILNYISDIRPTVTHCILWDNADLGGINESSQIYFGNPDVNYCCIYGLSGSLGGVGNIRSDPCFVDEDGNDFHLSSDSPCIDAGDPERILKLNETDIDGEHRIMGYRIDMGADEYDSAYTFIMAHVTKCTVSAGKIGGQDSFSATGNFINPLSDFNDINSIDVNIIALTGDGGHPEVIYEESIPFSPSQVTGNKYKYTQKLVSGQPGFITKLGMDFKKKTFTIEAKKIDLSGLEAPLQLNIRFGNYTIFGDADEDIINGKKLIPIRLMERHNNVMRVESAIFEDSSLALDDSLTVNGEIATASTDANLVIEDMNIIWDAFQTYTIPAGSFIKTSTTQRAYRCRNVAIDGAVVDCQFNFDKYTFCVAIKKATLKRMTRIVDFSIRFADFNETAKLDLP